MIEVKHQTFVLDNGLEVVLIPDRSLPKVVVDLWYDVGSYDDPLGRSGFAHLFEHLMFKGTARVAQGEFDRAMETVGGSNNASTGDERTNYYDLGPKHALDLFLWLEADRMTGLEITQEKLDVEREVVRNERRQNYEDAPYAKSWLELPRMLFPESHPLSRNGIGEHADLLAATLDDVREFYRRWYVPANAVLAVAGDFDPKDATDFVKRTFGALPHREPPARTVLPMPDRPVTSTLGFTDDVALPATIRAWHTPRLYQAGDAELDVLANLLTGSDDARLSKRLVYDEHCAQEIDATQVSGRWGSLFLITAHAAPGHTLAQVDAAIDEELAALSSTRPPTPEEVERGRNNREIDKLYGAESLLGRTEMLQSYRMHLGHVDGLGEDLARIRAVTPESVHAEAARLVPDRRALLHVVPE
jgi:zinc protease